MAGGLAADPEGRIWVADSLNGRLMIFTLPEPAPVNGVPVDELTDEGQNLNSPLGEEPLVDIEPTN